MSKLFLLILISILMTLESTAVNINAANFNISPKNINNTEGFLKLSRWLKGKNNVVVNFTKGTYWVGLQKKPTTNSFENISNILSIDQSKNIILKGNGAIIKFIDNLRFGSFDTKTQEALRHTSTFTKTANALFPGNFLYINNSSQITVSDFTIDGNSDNLILGGIFGDKGIQLSHRGIYITESFKVQLSNINIHHMGLDGVEIKNSTKLPFGKFFQVKLYNVKSNFNGRQGMSWTGGNGIYAENCEFSNTGKGKIKSSPGAGLDIEPEIGPCKNGTFKNCKFENNIGPGFGSDYFSKVNENILFDKCIFGGTSYWAIFSRNGSVTIQNSIVYGQIVSPAGYSPTMKLNFDNCKFYDFNYKDNSFCKFSTNHLIDAGGGQMYFEIRNSTFFIKKVKLCYIESNAKEEKSMPVFKNNIVNFMDVEYNKNDFIALFRKCVLENNTFNISSKVENGNFLISQNTKLLGFNKINTPLKSYGWNSAFGPKILP